MAPFYNYLIRSSAFAIVGFIALIFIPAWRLNYWQGWAYIATFAAAGFAYTAYFLRHDPALVKRRTEGGVSHEKEPAQKVIIVSLYIVSIALVVMSSLDVRFGWSNVPREVSLIGDALTAVSFYIFYMVSKVNTYAAASVRVELDQRVISTGVYNLVRHPMYFGVLILVIGTPLALASWWALLLVPFFFVILYFRIVNEERVLARDLPGYVEYRQKIRYRLIPLVW